MSQCMICNQIHSEQFCTNCGFDCRPRLFASQNQLIEWNRKIVLPYRKRWNDQNTIARLQQVVQELQTQLGQTKEEIKQLHQMSGAQSRELKQLREMVEALRRTAVQPSLSQLVQVPAAKAIPHAPIVTETDGKDLRARSVSQRLRQGKRYDGETPTVKGTITDSWEEIFQHIKRGDYTKRYSIGDTKELYLEDANHTCILMQIAGFDVESPRYDCWSSTISWISKECLPEKKAMGGTRNEILPPLREYLNESVWKSIPYEIRSRIKPVHKLYFKNSIVDHKWVYDKLWLLDRNDIDSKNGDYRQLFFDNASRRKKRIGSPEQYESWYLSSTEYGEYQCVLPDGTIGTVSADTELGIVLCFCTG